MCVVFGWGGRKRTGESRECSWTRLARRAYRTHTRAERAFSSVYQETDTAYLSTVNGATTGAQVWRGGAPRQQRQHRADEKRGKTYIRRRAHTPERSQRQCCLGPIYNRSRAISAKYSTSGRRGAGAFGPEWRSRKRLAPEHKAMLFKVVVRDRRYETRLIPLKQMRKGQLSGRLLCSWTKKVVDVSKAGHWDKNTLTPHSLMHSCSVHSFIVQFIQRHVWIGWISGRVNRAKGKQLRVTLENPSPSYRWFGTSKTEPPKYIESFI